MTSDARAGVFDNFARHAMPADTARAMRWRLTRQLALFLLFNLVIVNGLIWQLSPGGFDDTVLKQSWDMLRGVGGDDSWGPMAAALSYVGEQGKAPLYEVIFFQEQIKFQYPPSALFALEGMMLFGEERVRTYDGMTFDGLPPINDLAGWAFLMIAALSSAALLEAGLRKAAPDYRFDASGWVRVILVLGFTLTFYPAIKAFTLGQIQLWINSIFAAVMLLFVLRLRVASGALLGLVCLMKPHYGLFVLWGAIYREWRFAAACLAVGAAGLGLAIWHYGWANHLDYLRVLSFMSERGESFYANQSINGVLNRLASLFSEGSFANAQFDAGGFPPYTPWVYWGTVISSAIILVAAFLRKMTDANRPLAFATVAVSLTIASPIAWEHHYGVFLPVFAWLAGSLAGRPQRLLILALSYLFVSNFIVALNLLANSPLNVLQSYTLAGGVLLLVLTHVQLFSLRRQFSST